MSQNLWQPTYYLVIVVEGGISYISIELISGSILNWR
jgi:hypothetical protein